MRKPVKEIENVLNTHGYSINNIIFDVMKTFKFKTLCCQVGLKKQDGYSASEIITLDMVLPLMLLKSVNALYKIEFQKVAAMKFQMAQTNRENCPPRGYQLQAASFLYTQGTWRQ